MYKSALYFFPCRKIRLCHVSQDTQGLSFGKPERKLGWNAQPTTTVTFDDVSIPAEACLGPEGSGFKIAMGACVPWPRMPASLLQ